MWMREAVRREKMPTIDRLDNPQYFPYRYGQALWAYIGGRYGDRVIGETAARRHQPRRLQRRLPAGAGRDVEGTVAASGTMPRLAAYRPVAETTKMREQLRAPADHRSERTRAATTSSPELSPDGSRIAFFSSRDLFSIDLYIADAHDRKDHQKGHQHRDQCASRQHRVHRLRRRVVARRQAVCVSRAVWRQSRSSRSSNADNGDKEAEIPFKTLDEIMTPTWSPDGRRIAFTGMVGGYDDLFIYDLDAKSLHRVTNDAFAELQPAWSPDGKTIAFSTDRFGTNIERLSPGNLRLAFLDVASGQIREAGGFDNAKNINPEWGDDGSLYFVSDRLGISNVYRLPAGTETPVEVTNLLTGASGITDLSPALSVAGSRLAFSVYEADGYNIYAMDTPQLMAGGALWQGVDRNAGVLPPRKTGEGIVYAYLHRRRRRGSPSTQTTRRRRTSPSCRWIFSDSRWWASASTVSGRTSAAASRRCSATRSGTTFWPATRR